MGCRELGCYDYGSRFYDPALARFPTIDPKAESFSFQSPYSYAANNPILYIDKNGESPGIFGYGAVMTQAARDRYGKPGSGGKEYMQAIGNSAPTVLSIAAGATPLDAPIDAYDTYQSIKQGDVVGALAGVLAIAGLDFIKDGKKVFNTIESGAEATISANKKAGEAGENFLKETYGGQSQVSKSTDEGRRVIDNLTEDGVAQESKVGRTSLTKRTTSRQVAKDKDLLKNDASGVESVEWHFFPGKTGSGPTVPLRRELEGAGIKIIEH